MIKQPTKLERPLNKNQRPTSKFTSTASSICRLVEPDPDILHSRNGHHPYYIAPDKATLPFQPNIPSRPIKPMRLQQPRKNRVLLVFMIAGITAGALVIALSARFFARRNQLADSEPVTPPDCSGDRVIKRKAFPMRVREVAWLFTRGLIGRLKMRWRWG